MNGQLIALEALAVALLLRGGWPMGAGRGGAAQPASRKAAQALSWTAAEGLAGKSFHIPSAGDGGVEQIELAGRQAVRNRGKGSSYIYFDLQGNLDARRLYVTVEFLDRGLGAFALQYDSQQPPGAPLEASYRPTEAAFGAMLMDTGRWRKALFELHRPQFRGRQNHGADFRLAAFGGLAVSGVTVSDSPPADADQIKAAASGNLPVMIERAKGVEITIGGYDNFEIAQTEQWQNQLLQSLPLLHALGATSHETYVVWRTCQPRPDAWDWSHYDACVAAHQKAGLKWVPFVILGPSYTLPKWFYDSKEHVGYRCLEHDQDTAIQTLWHPGQPARVEAFLEAFARRYGKGGVIESVLLGITGNYGEAIYPASDGSDASWTSKPHGAYHSHAGMWCGDRYAVEDLRKWLRDKYGTIDRLGAAWGGDYKDWSAVRPIPGPQPGRTRAWLDTVDWYRASMDRWADLWLRLARKHLPPGTEIYLCTGGHAPPQHGSEFGMQSKLSAAHGAGVRITNEASNYPLNFSITRWVSSACRFYGTFFGYEPAGHVDEKGVVARIYNATASGAKQLHHYPDNILGEPARLANWKKYGHLMKLRRPEGTVGPRVDVAVWYPNRMVDLQRGDVWRSLREMREVCDYDIADARMILDGALEKYPNLVCLSDGPYERDVLTKVDAWVRKGGHLYLPRARGFRLEAVEDPRSPRDDRAIPEGWAKLQTVHHVPGGPAAEAFYDGLRKELAGRGVLVTGTRGVYATAFQDGSFLLLNMNDSPAAVSLGGPTAPSRRRVALEPVSITEVPPKP